MGPDPKTGREIFERRLADRSGNLFCDHPHPSIFNKVPRKLREIMERLSGRKIPHWSFNSIRKGVRTGLTSDQMDRLGYVLSEDIAEIVLAHSLGILNRRYNKSKYASQIGKALSAWEHLLQIEIERQDRWSKDLRKLEDNWGRYAESR